MGLFSTKMVASLSSMSVNDLHRSHSGVNNIHRCVLNIHMANADVFSLVPRILSNRNRGLRSEGMQV